MNEESIRELLDRLFGLIYKSNGFSGGYALPVIREDHRTEVEHIVRQWALDNHDSKVGTLEAKVFVYEQIISNSNFAPMIQNSTTRGGNFCDDKTESGLLEE